ncbi:DNA cytosine methyltransferase [Pedobacter hartonius]|uniref:DNA (cytosine-5-)-methyltransferase n=1 Tax=Pedobacter hartonius TaxID=425514 RepID=A0A1H4HHP8_9SPHI|nr:DNA cytosine methyltransferase [Pedobacter hartonius]SEB20558.1 DNA (cytosine-5)-methyltransferase 1 [Pedobacter hartonius]
MFNLTEKHASNYYKGLGDNISNKLKTINKIGIDIFSGAGGLSLGAESAGIKIGFAVEKDPSAAKTFGRNHPGVKVLCEDITKINPKFHMGSASPFIVFGGPPCQGFSLSNTKTRSDENSNNKLFSEFVRFVNVLQPEWFLFENVEGITNYNQGNTVLKIKECFREIGYDTTEAVLYASDYGVPQHRNRFFMVGNRKGINFEFPQKHDKKVNVQEALADLPVLVNGDNFPIAQYTLPFSDISEYAAKMRADSVTPLQNFVSRNQDYVIERYKHIKQGENWKAIPAELMGNYSNTSNCHSGIYKRLDANKPSVVISNYRKNMLIHPFQDRGLSVREAARLQSFPDSFVFEGPLSHIQQQIGNAVPPLLAEAIFRKILSY